MAQMHSYYITNAKTELKYSCGDLSEEELETSIQEVTMSMINNDDLFVAEEDDEFLDDESVDLNEENDGDLSMENIMNLDEFREQDYENLDVETQSDATINESDNSNIDFETILNEELGDLSISE